MSYHQPSRLARQRALPAALHAARCAALAGLLVACGTELSTPGEPLRFIPQAPPPAILNEAYNHNLPVAGGLAPYAYSLGEGALPPGIGLQGGFLRGVPTATGSYSFTVEVSDANLSVRPRQIVLEVIEPPPPVLELSVPETEIGEPFTVRGAVAEARELMALRTELRWDSSAFTLSEASIRALQNNTALFSSFEDGILRLDLALLGGASLSGRHSVFEFELVPLAPSTIQVESRSEFQRLSGGHSFARDLAGVAPSGAAAFDPELDGEDGLDEVDDEQEDDLDDDPDDLDDEEDDL